MTTKDVKFVMSAEDRASRIIRGVRGELASVQGTVAGVSGALGALGPAFAGALSVGGLTAWVRATVDGLDALNDLKDATGSSIENLSALEDVAARGGTSFESMSTAVLKFNKALNEAKPGSDTERILKTIGLDAEALKQIDPAEALRQVAVALNGYADDGKKARVMQEFLGKSTKDVAKFMHDLGEQSKLVATVTTEQAAEAKKFNDQLDALGKNSTDLARRLTRDLVPALSSIVEGYKKGGVKSALDALGEQIGLGAEFHERRAMLQLKGTIAGLEKQRDNLQKSLDINPKDGDALLPGLDAINTALARRNLEIEGLRTKYLRLTDGAAGGGRGFVNLPFTTDKPSLDKLPDKGATKDRTAENARIAAAMVAGEEQAAQDAAEAWQAWEKIQLADHKSTTEAWALQWKQVFDEIDADQERAIEEGKAFLDTKVGDVSDFAKEYRATVQGALGSSVKDVLSGDFGSIEKRWKDLLLNMAADALAANLAAKIFGTPAGNGSAATEGWLSLVLKASGSNVSSFAVGTDYVPRDMLALIHQGERIVPAAENSSSWSGGGIQLSPHITVNIDSRSDQGQTAAIVHHAIEQSNRALLEHLKAAGKI